MRDYGKVHSTFWSSGTINTLSDDGKLLALYLMTCGHGTIAGVFRLPDGYVAEDLGTTWPAQRVADAFDQLATSGFARRCTASKWVWIVKHLEWNKPENPNQRKAARKVAVSVPENCTWRTEFLRRCGPLVDLSEEQLSLITKGVKEPSANGSATVLQLLPQKQEQEQKQEDSSEPLTGSEPAASGFAIPLNDNSEYVVPLVDLAEWRKIFPAVDVEQELREMRAWSKANPQKRKTRRGINSHIVRWLQRAQDTPARRAVGGGGRSYGASDDWTGSAV